MPLVPLKQFAQSGATDGQVCTWRDAQGMWVPDDVLISSDPFGFGPINICPGTDLRTPGVAHALETDDYPALECLSTQTKNNFGSFSIHVKSAPSSDVNVDMTFKMKQSGTGTKVRVAVKTKSRALGEEADNPSTFDANDFTAVTITYTSIGEFFRGTVTIDKTVFAAGDMAVLHFGRDGNNELGAGTNDDASSRIQLTGILVR